MPTYEVTKKVDAYVSYTTVVEATDEQEAIDEVRRYDFNGSWRATGEVVEFDATEYFEEDVAPLTRSELADYNAYVAPKMIGVSQIEFDHIVAALRLWQRQPPDIDALLEIARCNIGRLMTDEEIDHLVERINT